eukprot:172334_1
MTKRMVKELDICTSRVVDLTPDNLNLDEHPSHQQIVKSVHQKLNLNQKGIYNRPYRPNYIWKNHWNRLTVNPYTKPHIPHHNITHNNIPQPSLPLHQPHYRPPHMYYETHRPEIRLQSSSAESNSLIYNHGISFWYWKRQKSD